MDKKTTGIIAYITWIGWIVAFCAGDKEGAKFHLNQALVITDRSDRCSSNQRNSCDRNYCWQYLRHLHDGMLAHGSDLCLPGAGEGSSPDRSDQDFKIINYQKKAKKNPRCHQHRGFSCSYVLFCSSRSSTAVSSAVVRFTSSGCSPCRNVMMIWIRL